MRQIAFEVRLVFLAIRRMMQESVVIVEDVPLGDGVVCVMRLKFCQCPIGDVFAAVCAVFVVSVERERLLWISIKISINNKFTHHNSKFPATVNTSTNHSIFYFGFWCWENRGKNMNSLVHDAIEE